MYKKEVLKLLLTSKIKVTRFEISPLDDVPVSTKNRVTVIIFVWMSDIAGFLRMTGLTGLVDDFLPSLGNRVARTLHA